MFSRSAIRISTVRLGRPLAIVFASIAACLSTIMVVAAGASSSPGHVAAFASASHPIDPRTLAQARAHFSVLSRTHRAHAASATGGVGIQPGIGRPEEGAILARTASGEKLYVWYASASNGEPGPPHGEELCFSLEQSNGSGGTACGAVARAEQHGITLSSEGGSTSLAALVPNGVGFVTVSEANGSSREVPVSDNVVAVDGSHLKELSYKLASGATESQSVGPHPSS
jgi:hypothetical protein